MSETTVGARLLGAQLPADELRTITTALRAAAKTDKGVTFLHLNESESRVTWAEVYDRAKRAAAYLASTGLAAGDLVLISAPPSLDFLDAFFGTMLAGAVTVPMAPAARTQGTKTYTARTRDLANALEPRLVIADGPSMKFLEGGGFDRATKLLPLEGLADQTHETLAWDAKPDDLALLQLSSGSGGDPKAVCIEHRHLTQHCAILNAALPGVTTIVSWLPLYHDMGLVSVLLLSICNAKDVVLLRPDHFIRRPALWLRALSRHRSEFCSVPNFAYAMCLTRVRDADMDGTDLSAWRHVLNGAEPIHPGLFRKFGERFARWGLDATHLRPTYGLAEATLAVTVSPEGVGVRTRGVDPDHYARTGEIREGKRQICSLGVPYPGIAVEIRDPEGKALGESRVGTIWVRSPTNMRGYYRNEQATAAALADGWLNTDDLGFIADGELYIMGRAKDIVVIRGANHAPEEFEECLAGMAGIRPGAVVAVGAIPEEAAGEELFMVVEGAAGFDVDDVVRRVRTAVLEGTGIRPHTVAVVRRGSLPRTTSGKLRRRETLRRLVTGDLAERRVEQAG